MKPDIKDIGAGLAISLFGLFFFLNSFRYGFGTSSRIGPGLFPLLVSALAILVGVIIIVPAFNRAGGPLPKVEWRAIAAVLAGVAAFAAGISYLGFVPAVFLCVCLCALGGKTIRPVQTVVLASLTTLAFWLLFVVGLELQIPAFGGAL
ncbi:MAG: tripartite tricarboxylate transporter TctB family protein [Bauldia sp.]